MSKMPKIYVFARKLPGVNGLQELRSWVMWMHLEKISCFLSFYVRFLEVVLGLIMVL